MVQERVVLLKYIHRLTMSRIWVELLWTMVDIRPLMLLNRSMKLDEVLAMSRDMINCWTNALLGSTLEEGNLEEAVAATGLPLRRRSPAWRASNKRPINGLMLRFDAFQTAVCSTGGIVKRNVGEGSHSRQCRGHAAAPRGCRRAFDLVVPQRQVGGRRLGIDNIRVVILIIVIEVEGGVIMLDEGLRVVPRVVLLRFFDLLEDRDVLEAFY